MQPLTRALPGAIAALLRDVPISIGKVDFAWRSAVGPNLGRVTAVRLEGRVLLVDVPDSNWAREVRRASPMILARLRDLLGAETVAQIDVRRHTR